MLKRSSHAVATVGGEAYVFGGELVPRQPRDGNVHVISTKVQGELACYSSLAQCPLADLVWTLQTHSPNRRLYHPHPKAQRRESEPLSSLSKRHSTPSAAAAAQT